MPIKTKIMTMDKKWKGTTAGIRFVDCPLNVRRSWRDEEGNLCAERYDLDSNNGRFILNGEKVVVRNKEGRLAFFKERFIDGGGEDGYRNSSGHHDWDFVIFAENLVSGRFTLENWEWG